MAEGKGGFDGRLEEEAEGCTVEEGEEGPKVLICVAENKSNSINIVRHVGICKVFVVENSLKTVHHVLVIETEITKS